MASDPHTLDSTERRRSLLVYLAVGLVVALSWVIFHDTGTCDDDYIVYRYAQNLVHGLGPVFNSGERVEGFTCPLWMLWIAGALALNIAPALASQVLGFVALFASASLALVLHRRPGLRPGVALACAMVIASSAALAFHAAQGLGTVLAAALLAGWYVALSRAEEGRGGYTLPAILLSLAALARPELAVFVPVFLWAVPRARRVQATALVALLPASWLAFRLAYYGEWLPMTWYVKKLPLLDDLSFGASYLASATVDTGFGVLLAVCVVARARRFALLARSATAALVGLLGATAVVLFVGGDYMWLGRFVVPLLPLACMLVAPVLQRLSDTRPVLARASWVLAFAFGVWPGLRLAELRESNAFYEQRWIAIGKELARAAPPQTRVATSPVGAIGYYSKLPIVDMLGMTNDAIRHAAPNVEISLKGHQRYDERWVLDQRPDMIILGNGEMPPGEQRLVVSVWEQSLFLDPRFQAEYEARLLPIEGSYPLPYFQRRGQPALRGSWK